MAQSSVHVARCHGDLALRPSDPPTTTWDPLQDRLPASFDSLTDHRDVPRDTGTSHAVKKRRLHDDHGVLRNGSQNDWQQVKSARLRRSCKKTTVVNHNSGVVPDSLSCDYTNKMWGKPALKADQYHLPSMMSTQPSTTTPFCNNGEQLSHKTVWNGNTAMTGSTADSKGSGMILTTSTNRGAYSQHFKTCSTTASSAVKDSGGTQQRYPYTTTVSANHGCMEGSAKLHPVFQPGPFSHRTPPALRQRTATESAPQLISAAQHVKSSTTTATTRSAAAAAPAPPNHAQEKKEDASTGTSTNGAAVGVAPVTQDLTVSPSNFKINDDGYIVTPGKHRIYISTFLMQGDSQTQEKLCGDRPALAAVANYAQDMYSKWRVMELQVDKQMFQLSFRPGTDIEKFRRTAVHFVLQHVHEWGLSGSTAHASILNIHRMLLHYVHPSGTPLTTNMFVGTVFACLRMAIKHEETPEKVRPLRNTPSSVCKLLGVNDPYLHMDSGTMNAAEQECLKILADPMIVPSSPDFLDRYLTVGGWPPHLSQMYRELALYLVNLSLFSRRDIDQLAGVPPSLLAAAALSLGIRVISAGRDDGYECWPQRLVVYTGYTLADLRPGIRGLSALLRTKPEGSEILEKFHPLWASFDWK